MSLSVIPAPSLTVIPARPVITPAPLSAILAPLSVIPAPLSVIPAQAGIQAIAVRRAVSSITAASRSSVRGPLSVPNANERRRAAWIPACAGMTEVDAGMTMVAAGLSEASAATTGVTP